VKDATHRKFRLSPSRFLKKFVLLSVPSTLLVLLVLEVVFRSVLPACEMPFVRFDPTHRVLTYDARGQTEGTHTIGPFARQRASWRVNNHGWNSVVDYDPDPKRARPLIAIIGDSYVEAFQVDVRHNLTSVLRDSLDGSHDVYGFGMSGAGLSQYLQMSRYVTKVFDPAVLVFVVVHNDFLGSLANARRVPHFLQLRASEAGFVELAPVPYVPSTLRRALSNSALARYLVTNLRIEHKLRRLTSGRDRRRFAANIDVDRTWDNRRLIEGATEHVVARARRENPDKEIVFVIDALRQDIYAGRKPAGQLFWLHQALRDAANANSCHFLDLNEAFREYYLAEGTRLDFEFDGHWNEAGHATAARGLLDYLRESGIAPAPDRSQGKP